MNIAATVKTAIFATLGLLLAGCGSTEYLVKDPLVMLEYGKNPSEENLDNLLKAYNAAINKNRKAHVEVQGLYSDYACALALSGRATEANVWFNKEMETFPTSKAYVMQLKKQLIPQFLNSSDTSLEGLFDQSDLDAKAAARHAAAEERAASVMDKTNSEVDAAGGAREENPTDDPEEPETNDNDEENVKESVE